MQRHYDDNYDDAVVDAEDRAPRQRSAHRDRRPDARTPQGGRKKLGRSPRNEADQAFKCGHCRAFIGAPITGGRNRNHCPMCLYSRHVDRKMPGDRLADCGSLMAPVGLTERRNGEEMIVHRCLGCGHAHPNRVAADDNPSVLADLPSVSLRGHAADQSAAPPEEDAIASRSVHSIRDEVAKRP